MYKPYAICFILIDRRQGQNYDWQARWETYVSLFSLWSVEFWVCFVNVLWWHSFFVTLSIKINTIISTVGNICHKRLVGLGKSTVDQVFRETACPSLGWIHLASCQKLVPRCGKSPMSPWGLAATQVFEPQAAIEEGCLASMARCWDPAHLVTSCCMLQECRGSQNLSFLKIQILQTKSYISCFDLWILEIRWVLIPPDDVMPR